MTHNAWCAVRATQDHELQLCARCGVAPETLLHRLWTCENNVVRSHPDVVRTQNRMARAVREYRFSLPSYVLRIGPASTAQEAAIGEGRSSCV